MECSSGLNALKLMLSKANHLKLSQEARDILLTAYHMTMEMKNVPSQQR